MGKKQKVELIIAASLIVCGSLVLIFPLFQFVKVKLIFMVVLAVYGILSLLKFLLTRESRDYEGLFTSIASIVALVIVAFLDVDNVPWFLALSLFIWIIFMSLIKLKKADYYNDRKNKEWILEIVTLILFILSGLLTTINLYYENSVQVLVLGYFYLIHGILELVDPLAIYLTGKK